MGEEFPGTGEAALLARSRQGDTSAFGELVTLHRERIYMLAYQMLHNEQDALDIAQDAFVKAWRSLHRFDGRASFSSWVHRIAVNAAIDLCRRRNLRPQTEIDGGPMHIDAASRTTPSMPERPGAGLERAELRTRLEQALATLSPEHRATFLLRERDDLSYEEIAETLKCSTGTVMSRLFYARKKLQTQLKDLHEPI